MSDDQQDEIQRLKKLLGDALGEIEQQRGEVIELQARLDAWGHNPTPERQADLVTQNFRLRAEVERLREALDNAVRGGEFVIARNARLRAALEPTHENLDAITEARAFAELDERQEARAILAAIRRRAGLEDK